MLDTRETFPAADHELSDDEIRESYGHFIDTATVMFDDIETLIDIALDARRLFDQWRFTKALKELHAAGVTVHEAAEKLTAVGFKSGNNKRLSASAVSQTYKRLFGRPWGSPELDRINERLSQLADECCSVADIANKLNAEGLQTRFGNAWTRQAVHSSLSNRGLQLNCR